MNHSAPFFSLLPNPLLSVTSFQCCEPSGMLQEVPAMRAAQRGWVGAGCPSTPAAGLAARAHWEIKQGMGSFGVFCIMYLPVNARVPYMARNTTRISRPSFIPPTILHSFIMSFINFLLKINSPIPFKFCIYSTSKHLHEFFIPLYARSLVLESDMLQ